MENDFSYDGDSDVLQNRRSSKLKKRRSKKSKKDKRNSPSPRKSRRSPGTDDEIDNDFSHESQADQALKV
eukprot:CAMPEP_0185595272 /NCGR_PEP_ID=MMETSP0434-20130131/77853_1 /TAXON_ID=626734 ORGANISM="Favella taraikaensis, Strain Fe Narragansett Bay" /NCGR_SAMPLE_ID=MMETSP0434 /ASSEMBLY_ACC=CAM_ASM_000379 /LENGTH=69 /DNA_ID=CAMNT_0028223173 /DNA_START=92 /DNA_END=298 /DNA_ORIENTATION=-